jgi:methylthioribose-1-phosphate isomerase
VQEPPVKPIEWRGDRVRIIDQRLLPGEEKYVELEDAPEIAEAIKGMAVRGAPLIGIAAAMAVALEARRSVDQPWATFRNRLDEAIDLLEATRPTASNLFWALSRMRNALQAQSGGEPDPAACSDALAEEALRIYEEDLATGIAMAEIGVDLIEDGFAILTHCNAGGLATSGFGTALAPMYLAARRGVRFGVFADETRPLLQGARLTAWELARAGIDVTVICDSAAHLLLSRGRIDIVFVGADRVTLSGDFANKIGTCGVAVSARASGVPFYVVVPTSSIDFDLEGGSEIPIEERDPREVTHIADTMLTPSGVPAYNPAFDVTPGELVTGFITEQGLIHPPYRQSLAAIKPGTAQRR